jgi:hypothetical protein
MRVVLYQGMLYWGLTLNIYLQHVKYKTKIGIKVCFTFAPCKTNEIEFVWIVIHVMKMRNKNPIFNIGCGYIALCEHDYSNFCILHPGAVTKLLNIHQCHYLKF